MAVELDCGVADQVGGGLVARDEQQEGEADHLRLAQALPIDLRGEQRAQQVVARLAPALREHLREVAPQLERRSHRLGGAGAVDPCRIELRDLGGLLLEPLLILGGHPEHLGDHDRRQRRRELAHQIELVPALEVVQQRAGDGADPELEERDAARREGAAHQRAQLRVARTVGRDEEGNRCRGIPVVACRQADHDALARDEEIRRLERVEHVVVAGERPGPQARIVMDRELFSEPAVARVRILVQLRIVGVEFHRASRLDD